MVGTERFELTTSCSQSRRSTRLSYVPNGAPRHGVDRPVSITLSKNYSNSLPDTPMTSVVLGEGFCDSWVVTSDFPACFTPTTEPRTQVPLYYPWIRFRRKTTRRSATSRCWP
jgi:hypothetical protein